MNIVKMEMPQNMYSTKCPHIMTPTRIVVHNTANDASARNEIKYMQGNNKQVSFHIAVDDVEAVQGIPLDRNAWHAGDGANGTGNRQGIAVEICYSKSGGSRFEAAERNAAELIAQMLKERGWGIDKVTKHQDCSGKYCPHRTLDMGWQRFLDMVQGYLDGEGATSSPAKSVDEIAQEVIAGKWGNGSERRERLIAAGYDYSTIQARVNAIMGGGSSAPATPSKTVDEVAQEVIAGKWGNGSDRKDRLTAAGYDYSQIQARANELLGESPGGSTSNSIAVGDTVRITCSTYSTGQSIPSWVKSQTHKVSQIKGDKALLGYPDGIASWVPLSGIVRA
ncbi:N-acetylmuramoyl-L-alanine amidase [Solibaculum mannosilyticum]|uniref:N-acetylmuramoyl-L-alanine amidase n=1 Tax=Solibaculum mannosilyticum TaxID=2780922 RepID=UPI0007A7F03E|nr:N-acetylmuramoyl-L-alanine amidase CwlA precursor [Eubacteriaceae bacterium CHKCI005]